MTCYSPIHGFKGPVNENGKNPIIFKAPHGSIEQVVPCGNCVGCRLDYSRMWAIRCVHESQMYENNCFLTMTYADEHMPKDGNLEIRDFQLFMKKLRKKHGEGIRFFHAGEYGTDYGRPHYHTLLFNHWFKDSKEVSMRDGNPVYQSVEMQKLWPQGFHSIGSVTMASASYTARYCLKKAEGYIEVVRDKKGKAVKDQRGRRYQVNNRTGEIRVAEYTNMSRNPGIGNEWYKRFKGDVYPFDEVIMDGQKHRVPRYYDNLLDKENPEMLESLKIKREENLSSYEERSDRRLLVKEEVKKASIKTLKRSLK